MKKAVVYARFSSDRQTEMSIDAQVRACLDYASQNDIVVVKTYSDEAISGKGSKTHQRKNYNAMLRDAERGSFDVILIHKYDRVARSLAEHVSLEQKLNKYNVQLVATAQDFGTTNESKIIRTLMWSLSEYYIDNLAEETRKGHTEAAHNALHNGGYPPFGYTVQNKQYVICEEEAMWVRKMFDTYISLSPLQALIDEMKAFGILGKRGKPIGRTQIYEILNNEKYTGTYVYSPREEKSRKNRRTKPNAIRVENAFPPIISKEQFAEVQKIMKAHTHKTEHKQYPCSGLVFCSCGAKMHVGTSNNKGHKYSYYRCSNKCGTAGVPVDTVETAVKKYIELLFDESATKKIFETLKDYASKNATAERDFYAAAKKKIEEKEAEYNSLMKNLSAGQLPASVVVSIGEQMEKLQAEIETIKNAAPPKEVTTTHITNWLNAVKQSDDYIRMLVERIDVNNKNSIKVTSTLTEFLRNAGCGGPHPTLPQILLYFIYSK